MYILTSGVFRRPECPHKPDPPASEPRHFIRSFFHQAGFEHLLQSTVLRPMNEVSGLVPDPESACLEGKVGGVFEGVL